MKAPPFRLMMITDRRQCGGRDPLDILRRAAAAGLPALQFREKDLTAREQWEWASRIKAILRPYSTHLVINDRADIAAALGAAGVHLPENGLPIRAARSVLGAERWVGVSVHTPEGALKAAAEGADYLIFGAVFSTPGKDPQGLRALEKACRGVQIPVLAVGGVTPEKAPACLSAGAYGVAAVRAFTQAQDVAAVVEAFLDALHSGT